MKALTIHQPYASLIAEGKKWVENRTWSTGYRGTLAIHAGKGSRYLNARELDEFPTGLVIATAELVACVPVEDHSMQPFYAHELRRLGISARLFLSHQYTEGPWCWILKDVRKLAVPVPAVGMQRLWEWEEAKQRIGHRGDFDPPVH